MESLDERIERVVDGLLDGAGPLWAEVAGQFPEVTTGDDPGRDERLIDALRGAIRDWLELNWPAERTGTGRTLERRSLTYAR